MDFNISAVIAQLWLHLHAASVSALAAAVATLGVVLLMELRSVLRLRQVMDNNLSRVFEQLDLLRFEMQQLLEGQQAMAPAVQVGALGAAQGVAGKGSPLAASSAVAEAPHPGLTVLALANAPAPATGVVYRNAAALAAGGASSREIVERLGLATGEARLLSSLAQARARRSEAASA